MGGGDYSREATVLNKAIGQGMAIIRGKTGDKFT